MRFTVTADSEAGEIVSFSETNVLALEDPGLIVGGFEVAESAKTSVRALSLLLSGLTTLVIWTAVFSVIWAPLTVGAVLLIRRVRRSALQPPTDTGAEAGREDPPAQS